MLVLHMDRPRAVSGISDQENSRVHVQFFSVGQSHCTKLVCIRQPSFNLRCAPIFLRQLSEHLLEFG